MLLIGFAAGGLVAVLTVALMCEDMVVAAMDEADELRAELNEAEYKRWAEMSEEEILQEMESLPRTAMRNDL